MPLRSGAVSLQRFHLIKLHLIERVPVSDLCDEYQLQIKIFYTWQMALMARLIS